MSERQKKHKIAEGVRNLKAKPGWDPSKFSSETTGERLHRSMETQRVGEVLAETEACEECKKVRDAQGDPQALCPSHLRKAMGL